jgi:hypothetical protein
VVGLADPLTEGKLTSLLTKVLEELCNLVSIHAGSRYLDRTCPVEVIVAEIEGKLLNHPLLHWRVVEGNEIVSWEDATLGCLKWDYIEIIVRLGVLVLDNVSID